MFPLLHASTAIIAGSAAVLAPAFGLAASPTAVAATALSARSAYSPVAAVRDKLPDLVMLPLTTCTREGDEPEGDEPEGDEPEGDEPRCKPFHIDHINGHEVLRFSTEVANRGEGRMEIVASRPSERVSDLKVVQNIYRSDGSIRHVRTRAIMRYAAQDGHEHFHVQQFEEMRIRPVGSSTSREKGHKEGFCPGDGWSYDPGSGDDDRYHGCGKGHPELLTVTAGISRGWVDDYAWNVWGQYVDLDGLHLPGTFCVTVTADPLGFFKEKTRRNNTTSALVRITSSDAQLIRQRC